MSYPSKYDTSNDRPICAELARKRGVADQVRTKRYFKTEQQAQEFNEINGYSGTVPYLCEHCKFWHLTGNSYSYPNCHFVVAGSLSFIKLFISDYPDLPSVVRLGEILANATFERFIQAKDISLIQEAVPFVWTPSADTCMFRGVDCSYREWVALSHFDFNEEELGLEGPASLVLLANGDRYDWENRVIDYFRSHSSPKASETPSEALLELYELAGLPVDPVDKESESPAPFIYVDEEEKLRERCWRASDLCHDSSWSVVFPRKHWALEIIYVVDEKDLHDPFNRKNVGSALEYFERKLLEYSEDRRICEKERDKVLQAIAYLRGETDQN